MTQKDIAQLVFWYLFFCAIVVPSMLYTILSYKPRDCLGEISRITMWAVTGFFCLVCPFGILFFYLYKRINTRIVLQWLYHKIFSDLFYTLNITLLLSVLSVVIIPSVFSYLAFTTPPNATVKIQAILTHDGNIGNEMLFHFYLDRLPIHSGDKVDFSSPQVHSFAASVYEDDIAHPDHAFEQTTFWFSDKDFHNLNSGKTIVKFFPITVFESNGSHSGSYRTYNITYSFSKISFLVRLFQHFNFLWYLVFSLFFIPALSYLLSTFSNLISSPKSSTVLLVISSIICIPFPLCALTFISYSALFPKFTNKG